MIQEVLLKAVKVTARGKLAMSEAVEVKVIWLILQETLEDLTAADLVIFDNFTSYLLFKSLITVFYPLYAQHEAV